MNFIVNFSESNECMNMMILINRLSKNSIIEELLNLEADIAVWAFIKTVYKSHELSNVLITDRDSQFIEHLWKRICQILKITRRLFTVYHLEIDEFIERMNAIVEKYVRTFTNYTQDDWFWLLLSAKLALKNKSFSSTKVSSFSLTHDYDLNLFSSRLIEKSRRVDNFRSSIERANAMIVKLKDAYEWIQMTMILAQQLQEKYVNKKRDSTDSFSSERKNMTELEKHTHWSTQQEVWCSTEEIHNQKTDRITRIQTTYVVWYT